MAERFRWSPPAPQAHWIDRPRVRRRLDLRFESIVTTVVAPAGYGKTSALSQALAGCDAPELADVWLQCGAGDADPAVFGAAVLRAGGVPDPTAANGTVGADRIADLLASYSPRRVCLVLDDVHRIADGSPTWQLIDDLVGCLPSNGHLLVSSRTPPPLALARLRASGELVELDHDDLEFDDDELVVRWSAQGQDPPADLGDEVRWPALVSLRHAGSPTGTVDYVVEELISEWSPDRYAAIAALAHVDDIDDDVAAAAHGSVISARDLIGDLPLVQRSPGGTFQLHDLWRQALTGRTNSAWNRRAPTEREAVARALGRVARLRLGEQRFVDAVRLFASADDVEGVVETAKTFARQPFILISVDDLDHLLRVVRTVAANHPVVALLESSRLAFNGEEWGAVARFEDLAQQCRTAGDHEFEALAIQHAINLQASLDPDSIPVWVADRAKALAAEHDSARVSAVMAGFHIARREGDFDAAAAVLQGIVPPSNDRERVTFAFAMHGIGRPEQVDGGSLASDAPGGALRIETAAGLWLRGDVAPELALELGRGLAEVADSGRFPHHEVQTNAVLAFVALSAGQTSEARRFADRAMRRSSATASPTVHTFARFADALCVVDERGEMDAIAKLESLLADRPLRRSPDFAYLWGLPTLYALVPGSREPLDRCRFGPSLSAALDAGRALVALRERGDARLAAGLAWDRPELLRAHVLPSHLAELAAAAAAAGNGAVGPLVDALPAARDHLAALTGHTHAATASWATAKMATLPARPADDLRIDVLGPLRLHRGATEVLDDDWVRRERVRQLLAFLVLHRRTTRAAVVDAIWPELEADKGSHNLRVNLGHLQRVLQPGRAADVPSWFVRVEGESLTLAGDGVVVDLDLFEHDLDRGRRLEGDGRTRDSVLAYRSAIDHVRGGLLEGCGDLPWSEMERLRVRMLITGARCRAGELLLALGEPEQAASHAGAVLAEEAAQERAARLLVHASLAQGDRSTARCVLTDLLERLGRDQVEPEPETWRLAMAYGVEPGAAVAR